MSGRFRTHLRSSLASAAVPYGYTLTIFASGAISGDLLGPPHAPQALVLVAGAVVAFTVLEAVAYGSWLVAPPMTPLHSSAVGGHAHLLSAGLAIASVWLTDSLLGGSGAAWALAGFLATGLYLVLETAQAIAVERPGA